MLNVENLTGGYSQAQVIKGISFHVEKGQLFGILGPNGSGKSTLMKMVSGILPYMGGDVLLDGTPIEDLSPKQLARKMAVLPQHTSEAFSYTVKEVVSIGRYAHQSGWFGNWSEADEQAVTRAMEQTGVSKFAGVSLQQLSGGERQRVYLAQALAQEPEILLLDEPTNHLDLAYQKELLDFLSRLTKKSGLTVLSIFHDLNLAGLYCDQLMLLENGKVNRNGKPADILEEKRISEVYSTQTIKHPHPQTAAPQMALVRGVPEKERSLLIDESMLTQGDDYLLLRSPEPLWSLSYGGEGAGAGWRQDFAVFSQEDCSLPDRIQGLGARPSEAVAAVSTDLEQACGLLLKHGDFAVFSLATKGAGEENAVNLWLFINTPLSEGAYVKMISAMVSGLGKARPASAFNPNDCLAAAGKKALASESGKDLEPLWELIEEAAFKAADGLLSGSAFVGTNERKGEF